MLARSWKRVGWLFSAGTCTVFCGTTAFGARYADVLSYYEPGQNVDAVYGSDPIELYDNPQAALGGPGLEVALSQGTVTDVVSLGGWSDDPSTGTNNRTPGLVVGFSVELLNVPGADLLIVGNAPSEFKFYEPGFIEVAAESTGGGATADGWQDETFYLLKPGYFAQITDPRTGPTEVEVTVNPDYSLSYSSPFEDDAGMSGYFDITTGGDAFDLDDAIDPAGNPVSLGSIAYVRLRSVSDSLFAFGSYFSPEVDYLKTLSMDSDYNGDGFLGLGDLDVVLNHWNQACVSGDLAYGDGNGDGFIGLDDLDLVLSNWNAGTPPTRPVVPEPASAVMSLAAACFIMTRRFAAK